jgi:hypothetical protein
MGRIRVSLGSRMIQTREHIYIVTCMEDTRDEMTGSSSDDWILLTLQLQPPVITPSHNLIAISHTLQSLFTLIFSVLICIHSSLLSL